MKKIFISHRSTDHVFAEGLVQFLENIGIMSEDIMYTSADYTGAKNELGREIKTAIREAQIFIVILSDNYFESVYCCNELGYIWATDKEVILFGLYDISSNKDYKGFVNDWVLRRLNNPTHIDYLCDKVLEYSVKKGHITLQAITAYKERLIDTINVKIEEKALATKAEEKQVYSPKKVIDMDLLISENYYGDKELLLFKYIYDTNDFIYNIAEDISTKVKKWERDNKLRPFLSSNLETFLIMLSKKNYLKHMIVSLKEWAVQDCAGKKDGYSKTMLSLFRADDNGMVKHNAFEINENLYRVIITLNKDSKERIEQCAEKYKFKWYQLIRKNKY